MRQPQQLLWSGFDGLDAEGVALPFQPGAVVLFGRNLDPDPARGPARCRALVDGLQARWGGALRLAVAVDQEGGPVSRLKPWTGPTPSLRQVWARGGAAACQAWGRRWGRGLGLLGFNVDFAPVADLWDGGQGAALGERAAGSAPREAAAAAGAFLHGLEGTGVRGCLKHFPGLGGLALDSHVGLPERPDAAEVARHAEAFLPLAQPDRLVMVAHLRTPHSDPLPASLHRGSVAENPWGVRARFLPDDLEMGGCADWPWEERTRRVLEAGHQGLLVCQTGAGQRACAAAVAGLPESLWGPALEASLAYRRALADPPPFSRDAWDRWLEELQAAARAFGC